MSQTPEFPFKADDSIKVGTTGTIGSLMSQELESMKKSDQTSSSSQKKNTTSPVLVPCVNSSKKTDCGGLNNAQITKQKPLKNGQLAPILLNEANTEKNTSLKKPGKKKRHTYIVEVVDIKCRNPMSSCRKKPGFSKLSESIG